MPPDLDTALHEHFGFSDFRAGQRDAMNAVLAARDALVVMPTGSGKSLCYQLPALVLPHTTLVISPLIALMKDQVDALIARNKPAMFINRTLPANEQREHLTALARGAYKIAYVAPERLRNAEFLDALARIKISLVAVDEAHCISHWGHDFRPDYMHIRDFAARIGRPPIVALTATATPQVQTDIIAQLGLNHAEKIVTGFNRPNLALSVRCTPNEKDKLRELTSLLRDGLDSTVIYTGTRREAEEVAEFCGEVLKIRAAHYHAGLEDEERARVQDAFMADKTRVIAATNALGMGVDKPDIRAVIHYTLPSTVEAYYQEIGRAGRDGKPARGILFYSPEDRALQEWFIENDAPEPQQVHQLYALLVNAAPRGSVWASPSGLMRQTGLNDTKLQLALRQLELAGALKRLGDARGLIGIEVNPRTALDLTESAAETEKRRAHKRRLLAQMITYAETNACRRRFILDYFGDAGPADAIDCCDNHIVTQATPSLPEQAETQASDSIALTILECVRGVSNQIGRLGVTKILAGSREKGIKRYERSSFYGILAGYARHEIDAMVAALIGQGYIKVVGGQYPVVALSPQGAEAIKARATIVLDLPQMTSAFGAGPQAERLPTDDAGSVGLTILECLQTVDRQLFPSGVTKILTGSDAKGYERFAQNPFYGKLARYERKQLDAVMKDLIEKGYVQNFGGVVGLTPLGTSAVHSREGLTELDPGVRGSIKPERKQVPPSKRDANAQGVRQAGGTVEYTLELARQGHTPAEIAEQRGLSISTIYGHLERLVSDGRISGDAFVASEVREKILAVLPQWNGQWLSDLKALLPEEITYDEIRFVLAARNVKTRNVDEAPPSEIETKGPDRAHVVWQMGEKGTREDVPTLIETLKDTDGNVRRLAASALGKIKDTRAVTPLIQLLNDDKPQVRQYAIKALGEIGSPEAKSALEQIADDAQEKDYNRQSALHALKSLSTSSEETAEDSVHAFLSRAHPKPLRGPWRAGFALDFHSKFVGSQHVRTELGELIYRFKYAGDQAVGETLAARLADFIRAHPELRADVLIPVPSTKKDRAYDPVPTLARLIAARTDLVLNETALVKARATEPQKAMVNLAQKSSNVAGAFRVTDPGAIRGKRVLLLDDFYDSGATLAEATRVLLNAGAREVVVLTVTKTIHTD